MGSSNSQKVGVLVLLCNSPIDVEMIFLTTKYTKIKISCISCVSWLKVLFWCRHLRNIDLKRYPANSR
jgi:hypothetical protein